MTDDHQLDELASAHLDGTTSAPEAARIAADPDLRARVEELRAVRAALRVPPPVNITRREAAIGAALAAFAEETADATTAADRGQGAPAARMASLAVATRRGPSPRTLRLLGAAAAVALLAALVPLLGRLNTTDDADSATGAADTSLAETADADAGAAPGSTARSGPEAGSVADEAPAASQVLPVDLGRFDDVAALVAAIEASGLGDDGGRVSEYTSGADGDGGCLEAGADEAGADGAITVEAATATVDGSAVVVLVATDDRGTRTLRVLLSVSCGLLAELPL